MALRRKRMAEAVPDTSLKTGDEPTTPTPEPPTLDALATRKPSAKPREDVETAWL